MFYSIKSVKKQQHLEEVIFQREFSEDSKVS